jgi:hypothetical protein
MKRKIQRLRAKLAAMEDDLAAEERGVLLDAAGQPAGRVECFGHTPGGEPCRAAWAGLLQIAQDLDG